jgi:hypothetical protein
MFRSAPLYVQYRKSLGCSPPEAERSLDLLLEIIPDNVQEIHVREISYIKVVQGEALTPVRLRVVQGGKVSFE